MYAGITNSLEKNIFQVYLRICKIIEILTQALQHDPFYYKLLSVLILKNVCKSYSDKLLLTFNAISSFSGPKYHLKTCY